MNNQPEKSNAMYLFIVATWIASGAWISSRILAIYHFPEPVILKLVYLLIGATLAIFWYYALYHYALLLFTRLERRRREKERKLARNLQQGSRLLEAPSVAVLYTTADDFVEEAAFTCVNQDYPSFHVFLLDDSRLEKEQKRIDGFQRRYSDKASVIRREDRRGFKAGNLNHFLATIDQTFSFFSVCDADEMLPREFLSSGLKYFEGRPWLGFLQATHTSASPVLLYDHPLQPLLVDQSAFSRDFQDETRIRWEYNNVPRNRYGFPLFLGHGVICRVAAWEAAGGFPEVVAEDVAFTVAMRSRGYYGLFAQEITCGERFPEDLSQFTKRHFRMVMGDTEALVRYGLPFLRAKRVALVEKLDLVTHAFRRTTSGLVLPFITGTILLQLLGSQGNDLLTEVGVPKAQEMPMAWDLALFGLLGFIAPLARVLAEGGRTPLRSLAHAGRALCLHMTLAFESTLALITLLLAGKAHFVVTGAKTQPGQRVSGEPVRVRIARLDVNHPVEIVASLAGALFLLAFGILSLNIALVGVAVAAISLHLLARLGWDSKLPHGLSFLAALLMLAGIFLGPLGIAGPHWQYMIVMGTSVLVRT